MITFNNVSKYYPGKIPGLIDVTVEIPAGEFMFLIGPSGSGKTTFLRLLIRDLLLSKGTITVDNEDISNYTGKISTCYDGKSGSYSRTLNFFWTVLFLKILLWCSRFWGSRRLISSRVL